MTPSIKAFICSRQQSAIHEALDAAVSKGRLAPCLLGVHFTAGEQASPRGGPRTVCELVRRAREKGKQRSGEDGGGRRRVPFHQGGQGGHTHTAYCPNQETQRGSRGWVVSVKTDKLGHSLSLPG